jgi:hypothetical protein
MRSRSLSALAIAAAVAMTAVMAGRFTRARAAGQPAQPPAASPSQVQFLRWPLPATGKAYSTIDGARLWQDVRRHADIAEHYREQGHPQFWGIIAGTSGDADEARWLLGRYEQIGLTDAHIQPVNLFHPQWAPRSWEVAVTGDGRTTPLTSAQPAYATASTNGNPVDLPVVYAGLGSEADLAGRDVRGKAVLLFREVTSYSLGPPALLKRLESAGAAAIFMSDFRGGNYSSQSYRANSNVPTFNLGTEDALLLRDRIGKAPVTSPPHLKIRLDASWAADQQSFLVWGTLPGATDETIYVIAHRDGWFDAAGDNASGVATLLGLAEYFASVPRGQRRRTMIFIGTDGHHANNPSGYGREWLAANRDRLFSRTALMINAEHTSVALTRGGTAGWTQSIVPLQWYAGGPSRPQLPTIAAAAFREFGVPLWDLPSPTPPSGDMLPFAGFLPGIVIQSNDFPYMHTSGDSPANVAPTGLEAATRAYARIIDEVNTLSLSDLQRLPEPGRPRVDFASCPAWVSDSSAACLANSERTCAISSPGC